MNAPMGWQGAFFLSETSHGFVVFVLAFFYFHFLVIPTLALLYGYSSRKLIADIQARVGPNRTGPIGGLQGFADTLKLFFRQRAQNGNGIIFFTQIAALFSVFAALPLGIKFVFVQSELNILLPFISLLILCFFKILEAGDQEEIENTLIGFRGGFITLSAFVPALCSLLVPCVMSGKMDWESILLIQGALPYHWFGFSSPFGVIAAITFIVSGMILFQVPPFSVGTREKRKYQSSDLILYEMTRFYGFFIWCVLAVALFYGGAGVPEELGLSSFIQSHAQIVLTVAKAGIIWIVIQIFGKTLPTIRVERITDLVWKFVFPTSLIALIGSVFWTVGFVR